MKFATVAILFSALAAASPVYHVEWVTLTKYTTVSAGHDEYTSAFPENAPTTLPEKVVETPATTAAEPESLTTVSQSEITLPTTLATTLATTLPQTPTPATPATSSKTTTSSTETSSAPTGQVFSGEGTYYDTGLGACGITNTDSDYIVALGHGLFDQHTPAGNPNKNALCGRKIIAHYGGKSVEVTAVDRCEACLEYDLDFSPAAFEQIADKLLGRIKITWQWA